MQRLHFNIFGILCPFLLICASSSACATPAHIEPKTTSDIAQDEMGLSEAFFRRFCVQQGLAYGSDACRNAFLQAWAQESLKSGKALSKEGFEQLDEAMKKGSFKLGVKWGEYSKAFKEGAKSGARKK